jgi:hypothetical protein
MKTWLILAVEEEKLFFDLLLLLTKLTRIQTAKKNNNNWKGIVVVLSMKTLFCLSNREEKTPFRTLSQVFQCSNAVLSSLYVLAYSSKDNPLIVASTACRIAFAPAIVPSGCPWIPPPA